MVEYKNDFCDNIDPRTYPIWDRYFTTTVNFQNNAQVQINAWFKLTPGYQAHCLQFITLFFVFQKNAWFNLTPGLMLFENN